MLKKGAKEGPSEAALRFDVTPEVQRILAHAWHIADRTGGPNAQLEPTHVMLAMLQKSEIFKELLFATIGRQHKMSAKALEKILDNPFSDNNPPVASFGQKLFGQSFSAMTYGLDKDLIKAMTNDIMTMIGGTFAPLAPKDSTGKEAQFGNHLLYTLSSPPVTSSSKSGDKERLLIKGQKKQPNAPENRFESKGYVSLMELASKEYETLYSNDLGMSPVIGIESLALAAMSMEGPLANYMFEQGIHYRIFKECIESGKDSFLASYREGSQVKVFTDPNQSDAAYSGGVTLASNVVAKAPENVLFTNITEKTARTQGHQSLTATSVCENILLGEAYGTLIVGPKGSGKTTSVLLGIKASMPVLSLHKRVDVYMLEYENLLKASARNPNATPEMIINHALKELDPIAINIVVIDNIHFFLRGGQPITSLIDMLRGAITSQEIVVVATLDSMAEKAFVEGAKVLSSVMQIVDIEEQTPELVRETLLSKLESVYEDSGFTLSQSAFEETIRIATKERARASRAHRSPLGIGASIIERAVGLFMLDFGSKTLTPSMPWDGHTPLDPQARISQVLTTIGRQMPTLRDYQALLDLVETSLNPGLNALKQKFVVGSKELTRRKKDFKYNNIKQAVTLEMMTVEKELLAIPKEVGINYVKLAAYGESERHKLNQKEQAPIDSDAPQKDQVQATSSKSPSSLIKRLSERVMGQDEAVKVVAKSIAVSDLALRPRRGPVATFLFLGPTGVGKTELAKAVAKEFYEDEQAIIRIDMSEFSEKHEVAKLIGAPPGYVGYGEGGVLTEAIKKKPRSVVLLDEVEKAHPKIFDIFLQVLDEGRLTDGEGNTVNFSDAIVIGTSNLGSQHWFKRQTSMGFAGLNAEKSERSLQKDEIKALIQEETKDFFRPELLNRFSAITIFDPLSEEVIENLVAKEMGVIIKRLYELGVSLKGPLAEVSKILAKKGFNPANGARHLKRAVHTYFEVPLAEALLEAGFDRSNPKPVTLLAVPSADLESVVVQPVEQLPDPLGGNEPQKQSAKDVAGDISVIKASKAG